MDVDNKSRTKSQIMLRLSGQNADQKLGQIANHKKSPDKMPTFTCYQTGFIHMAKPIGGSMAKPMVLYRAQSYGKTHWMGKAIGESMVKAMEPRL